MRHSAIVYFSSYGLSLLGAGISSVVMPLLVLARTGDVLAAGVLATVATAASAATGIVSGLLVDRFNRRTVSVVSNALSALSVATLPLVDVLWGLDMTWFVALALVGAVIRVPGMTAHETLLPALIRAGGGRLDRMIATRETVGNVLLLGGPGLGGLFVWLFGTTSALMLATASLSLLAAASTLLLDPRAGAVEKVVPAAGNALKRAVTDLAVSWRFLVRSRIVLGSTLITAVFAAVISSLQTTLMPAFFTREDLPALAGLTLSALSAGSIAGSALYAVSAGRVRRRTWFVIGMAGTLVGFAAVGSMASPWVVLGAAAFVGLTNGPAGALLGVLTVEATPDEMRGRVLGAQNTLVLSAPALTSAPIAAIAAGAGLETAGMVLAALVAVTSVAALLAPAFRSLDEERAPEFVGVR
ncbi:MFS transporter [Pseudonocardia endophytica]|uniref:Multidrug efflux pump Tap n=1 Tax=Pseudonocardia endophytica TaxID=401976 RepID=A0A4R1I3E1_PSEEN|nr:MFS transporter [Pseudonocardia endophytica]TCK27039.1 MFS transporter [Pseudonocardia endophytica]